MEPQVVRYSERPGLWQGIGDLSAEVWPEYNVHGQTLNYYWDQLYEVFPEWQFVLYDPQDETVLAEAHTIPVAWDGTETGDYVFPAGLTTLHIDRDLDLGEYFEPNVWIIHPPPARSA